MGGFQSVLPLPERFQLLPGSFPLPFLLRLLPGTSDSLVQPAQFPGQTVRQDGLFLRLSPVQFHACPAQLGQPVCLIKISLLPQCGKFLRLRGILRDRQLPGILKHTADSLIVGCFQAVFLLPEKILHPEIFVCIENLPEDLPALIGVGVEQPQKVPLGNHNDLGKLIPVYAQQRFHRRCHLPDAGHNPAVREAHFRFAGHFHPFGRIPLARALIVRTPADAVGLSPEQEFQFHKGLRIRSGKVASHGGDFPAFPAGLPI